MRIVHLRILLGVLIGAIALITVILTYFYSEYGLLILSVQGVLLTTICPIGSNCIENQITEEHERLLENIETQTSKLNEKYNKARMKIKQMEEELLNSSLDR